ncbi:MAG: DUF2304 family protein [Ignavibacteria bacterium]|nr:DUF2304 family protein [Ignavibacteria bacterium]
MPLKAQLIIIFLSFSLFLFVLNLIRKRHLKIEHSVLWLVVSVTILVASIWQNLADQVALFLGIEYPPALFLSMAIFFSLVILMHFSIELSRLKDQNKTITQELALYKNLIKKLERKAQIVDESHTINERESRGRSFKCANYNSELSRRDCSMINLLTFDIEDWYHPTLAFKDSLNTRKLEDRVVEPTLKILNMLVETNNKATFFVLGEVAEKFPELVQEIVNRGHEVGSHGYRHDLVYDYTKQQFEADIKQSVTLLENITNQKVLSYRAPSWSLNNQTPWAWEVLSSFGFTYDSSLYPYKTFLYGSNDSPRFEYDINLKGGDKIKEIPPSVAELFKKRLPFSGGFFLRVAPIWYIKWCINQFNEFDKPAVIYLHPWEIDVDQPRISLNLKDRFIMYVNLKNTEKKLLRLLKEYRFDSIKNYFLNRGNAQISIPQVLSINEMV